MNKLILSLMATLTILSGCSHKSVHNKENQNKPEVVQKTIEPKQENNHFVEILSKNTKSNIKSGATDRGAIMTTTLDSSNRPVGAHIRLMDKHEPGSNDIKRPGKIQTDPYGWANFKLNGNWINNRTHLVGWQFSEVNDEYSNLVTATSYLNKGTNEKKSDTSNPEGMLFYETKLDKWLKDNPDKELDLFVKPIYETSTSKVPSYIYMQWVGIDKNGKLLPIDTQGKAEKHEQYYYVLLENKAPGYTVNTETGVIK